MPNTGTESQFEETTIDRLKQLGYRYEYGGNIDREPQVVVLPGILRSYLQRRYRHLPPQAIELAIQQATAPQGVALDRRNLAFQDMFRRGFILKYEENNEQKAEHIYLADFEQPEHNDFLVVNQLSIQGPGGQAANTRRPDLVIYVNGLPLVVFELKSPWSEYADANGAHNQLRHYVNDIPQLFNFNAFCVVSDGNTTLHGVHSAELEWFAPWKSIDGRNVEPNITGTMKTLIEGLFPKDRLLNYIRNFLVHAEENEVINKKGARYHQFFAVNFAVQEVLRAMQPNADKRAGVVWHTQGSGKSLEMVFLVGILRRWPGLNPLVVIEVDRNDLDSQLYESFVAAKSLVGDVSQAESVEDLRARLSTHGGEVICTTIEKFALKNGEKQHPQLSNRHDVIVIADEAHRTQYGLKTIMRRDREGQLKLGQGHALNLRQALPYASYLGFTGTPIDKEDANTIQIFGEYIHVYDMQQAREDNAVVKILYEARHIPLVLENEQIDTELEAIAEELEVEATQLEEAKAKWAVVERAAGTDERLAILARDLLDHFNTRQEALTGKAMIVCMSRANCVGLYDALTTHPDCPEVKVVMTGNLAEDPPAWSEAGHITTRAGRELIKARFVEPDDPLKLVIVCDMWLTGFDAPCVNTMYVDKLMKGHNLMQAIARVNRVFRDKDGGLIVDYIGIGDRLKEATRKYTNGGGRGTLTEDLSKQALAYFLHQVEATRSNLPDPTLQGLPANAYAAWRDLSNIQLEDLCNLCYGTLAADEQLKEDFLVDELRLSKSYSLVSHLPEAQKHSNEVAFYQMTRHQLRKLEPEAKQKSGQLERAVRDLLDESIAAQPAFDIFARAGLEKPEVSILDDEFLAGFRRQENQDLQMRLLLKLLQDELYQGRKQNIIRYRSFKDMLEEALSRYNNRIIEAHEVVKVIQELHAQLKADEERKAQLKLTDEELAFYDVITLGQEIELHQTDEWIADLVRQIVQAVRSKLQVDWTKPHRADVEAAVQSAVSQVLRRNRIKGEQFTFLINRLMKHAKVSYEDWPMAA